MGEQAKVSTDAFCFEQPQAPALARFMSVRLVVS